jgi:hypothetical protein
MRNVSAGIALISSHNNIFLRNKALFENLDLPITFVGCDKDELANQEFITQKYHLKNHESCDGRADFLIKNTDLLSALPEFIFFEADDWLYQISRSDLPIDLKIKLLPVRNPKYFHFVGSKIGQIQIFESIGIKYPETCIIESDELTSKLFSFPYYLKGERFSGGAKVFLINSKSQLQNIKYEKSDKFLIQKVAEGKEISIDAFYRNGKLIFTSFSAMNDLLQEY